MTREKTDAKNLTEATEIKKSGFKTKIHAGGHKDEIDKWILENKWSSDVVVNELKRLYPDENHPSNRAIDNYRKRYLPKEYLGRANKVTQYPDELREELIRQFDPAQEGSQLWTTTKEALEKATEVLHKTNVPPKFLIELLRVSGQNFQIVTDIYKDLGLVKREPTEINLTEKKTYEPGELKPKIERISKLVKRMEDIEGRTEHGTGDTSVGGGTGNNSDQEGMSEKHGQDDGTDSGVQERTSS